MKNHVRSYVVKTHDTRCHIRVDRGVAGRHASEVLMKVMYLGCMKRLTSKATTARGGFGGMHYEGAEGIGYCGSSPPAGQLSASRQRPTNSIGASLYV